MPGDGKCAFRIEDDTGVRLMLWGKTVIGDRATDGGCAGRAALVKDRPSALTVDYFFDHRRGARRRCEERPPCLPPQIFLANLRIYAPK